MAQVNNLLLDIGNSDIKIGTGNSKNYSSVKLLKRFPYSKNKIEKDFIRNFDELKKNISFNKVGISILKNENKRFLNYFFKKEFDIKPLFINKNLNLPIKINYSKGLGNDRICNAVAADKMFNKKNILIIDFGTATTYTMVSNNILIGGMISPGIGTSLNSLIYETSLPKVDLIFPRKLINNTTVDNIKAGVLYQSFFSVERIIAELKKEYKNLYIIATGGYAILISNKTKLINKVDKNLVLKGINIIISI